MDNFFFLTKQSRKVLKGLVGISSGEDCDISFHGSDKFVSPNGNDYSFGKYSGEIKSILKQLSDGGFIVLSGHGYSLRLTQEGLHYFQYRKAQFYAYVLDKWIDFTALIISIVALCLSISALLK